MNVGLILEPFSTGGSHLGALCCGWAGGKSLLVMSSSSGTKELG